MKAAVVLEAGKPPVFAGFEMPMARAGEHLVSVRASALSPFTKSRAAGAHYSADSIFPSVAGTDGVGLTEDGRRVYFVLPEAPFGALAEFTRVSARRCIELPPALDDITAAAIANPGMSAWAALVYRARIQPGETVLINGATGTAGRLAVQLARHLGAGRIIAIGRNGAALEEVRALGADVVIPFDLADPESHGARDFEASLAEQFGQGIDVVVDYLWGRSAELVLNAIARAAQDATPVRFVHVGGSSGSEIVLAGAALRASAITLMGSGIRSVPQADLRAAIEQVLAAVIPAGLKIATRTVPLSAVEETWNAEAGRSRVVFIPDQAAEVGSRPG